METNLGEKSGTSVYDVPELVSERSEVPVGLGVVREPQIPPADDTDVRSVSG